MNLEPLAGYKKPVLMSADISSFSSIGSTVLNSDMNNNAMNSDRVMGEVCTALEDDKPRNRQ